MWNGSGIYTLPYGYGTSRRYISKQYSYFLQPFDYNTPPYDVSFNIYSDYPLPVDLATVKNYLKMDVTNTAEDNLITMLILVATSMGEKMTKRDFIVKKYLTYRNDFTDGFFTLRKSLFQSLLSFEYLVDNVWTVVPSTLYYNTSQTDYSGIFLSNNQAWPNNIDQRLEAIRIIFYAGYGTTPAAIPPDLKLAILQHIMTMYMNRGDCVDCASEDAAMQALPPESKFIYQKYRIKDLTTIPY